MRQSRTGSRGNDRRGTRQSGAQPGMRKPKAATLTEGTPLRGGCRQIDEVSKTRSHESLTLDRKHLSGRRSSGAAAANSNEPSAGGHQLKGASGAPLASA